MGGLVKGDTVQRLLLLVGTRVQTYKYRIYVIFLFCFRDSCAQDQADLASSSA